MEYLMGGAYCSTYTQKPFRAVYSRLQEKVRIHPLLPWAALHKLGLTLFQTMNAPEGETGKLDCCVKAATRIGSGLQQEAPAFL